MSRGYNYVLLGKWPGDTCLGGGGGGSVLSPLGSLQHECNMKSRARKRYTSRDPEVALTYKPLIVRLPRSHL